MPRLRFCVRLVWLLMRAAMSRDTCHLAQSAVCVHRTCARVAGSCTVVSSPPPTALVFTPSSRIASAFPPRWSWTLETTGTSMLNASFPPHLITCNTGCGFPAITRSGGHRCRQRRTDHELPDGVATPVLQPVAAAPLRHTSKPAFDAAALPADIVLVDVLKVRQCSAMPAVNCRLHDVPCKWL